MPVTPRSRGAAGVALSVLAAALCLAPGVQAHRLRPAVVTVTLHADGDYQASIVLDMETLLASLDPRSGGAGESPHTRAYEALRRLPPVQLRAHVAAFEARLLGGVTIAFDGRRSHPRLVEVSVPEVGDVAIARLTTLTLRGEVPSGARTFTWANAPELGASVLRVLRPGGSAAPSVWLEAGAASEPIDLAGEPRPSAGWRVAGEYVALGFTHILPKGKDHILFVLGIFLLSLRWRPLLYQVTAFTVAHSVTLALSLYDLVWLPASIVEPLIALSIVYVAVENVLTRDLKPWRVYVVFAFGLLHGLGFAGVLAEIGLPGGEFLTALVAFNVGVELGQLAVVSLAFLAVGFWFKDRAWFRSAIVVPASVAISLTGAYWMVERLVA